MEVEGASEAGTLAYNSWLAMRAAGESDDATCTYNSLALVRVDAADAAKVNPSVPGWGGPVGVASYQQAGDVVYAYGDADPRGDLRALKRGAVITRSSPPPEQWSIDPDGWSTTVYTAPTGMPGDSGSPYLDASGNAAGLWTTGNAYTYWDGVSDIPRVLAYAQQHSGLVDLVLVNGTEPFTANP